MSARPREFVIAPKRFIDLFIDEIHPKHPEKDYLKDRIFNRTRMLFTRSDATYPVRVEIKKDGDEEKMQDFQNWLKANYPDTVLQPENQTKKEDAGRAAEDVKKQDEVELAKQQAETAKKEAEDAKKQAEDAKKEIELAKQQAEILRQQLCIATERAALAQEREALVVEQANLGKRLRDDQPPVLPAVVAAVPPAVMAAVPPPVVPPVVPPVTVVPHKRQCPGFFQKFAETLVGQAAKITKIAKP